MELTFKNKLRWIDYEECKFILAAVWTASGLLRAEQAIPIAGPQLTLWYPARMTFFFQFTTFIQVISQSGFYKLPLQPNLTRGYRVCALITLTHTFTQTDIHSEQRKEVKGRRKLDCVLWLGFKTIQITQKCITMSRLLLKDTSFKHTYTVSV